VRHAGPMDIADIDDDMLERISAGRGPLPALSGSPGAAWRSPAFPGCAWYNAAPPPRPYTAAEKRLVDADRACEVVALQFDAPTNTTTILRTTIPLWTRKGTLFLNGRRIPLTAKTQTIPVAVGFNRLLLKYPCRKGDGTACMQMSAYPWDTSTCWPCIPFP